MAEGRGAADDNRSVKALWFAHLKLKNCLAKTIEELKQSNHDLWQEMQLLCLGSEPTIRPGRRHQNPRVERDADRRERNYRNNPQPETTSRSAEESKYPKFVTSKSEDEVRVEHRRAGERRPIRNQRQLDDRRLGATRDLSQNGDNKPIIDISPFDGRLQVEEYLD